MNQEEYQNVFSRLHASEEKVKEVIEMKEKRQIHRPPQSPQDHILYLFDYPAHALRDHGHEPDLTPSHAWKSHTFIHFRR